MPVAGGATPWPRRNRRKLNDRWPPSIGCASNLNCAQFYGRWTMKRMMALAAAAMALGGTGAHAQDKLKVGVVATLSGPPAVLGQQLRNGFSLAVKGLGGKLGGREAEIIVQD